MNLKKPPKRADSKISCLRITVPENLDLALEGLIRKVLREQPKTDDIHTFAAEYFETLLRIRDKAGAKYSPAQLCPFHNDEDAHEMIKLASSFGNSGKKRSREPGPPPKGEEKGREKRNGGRGTVRRERLKKEGKQATPDLIKKLPGNRVGDEEKKGVVEKNGEEESLADDPIKELVEKELMMKTETRETREEADESNDVEDKEQSKGKEETKNIVEGINERGKPSNEEAHQGRTGDEVEHGRTAGGEAVERVLGEQAPLLISTQEEERDKKEEETDKQSETNTFAKAEATDRLLMEDKLATGEKMTEKDNANEVPPDSGNEVHSISVDEMVKSTAEELRDKNQNETIESISAEDVTTDNDKRVSLSENADEDNKNNSEEEEETDPTGHPKSEQKRRKNEEISAAREETLEDTQKINEEAKPEEAVAGGTETEATVHAIVEMPSGPVDTEDESKINGSDQYVEPRKDGKDKEKPVENETTGQLFPAGDAAPTIKETATADVSAVESEPQDSEADMPGDELCTVVDVRQIPASSEVTQMKEDATGPEECLVVDGQHIIRVEEPESGNGNSVASQPPEEVQIKTIQTHYYDTLQVPEAVTKELRVHNMVNALSGVADAGKTSRPPGTEEESTGGVKDDSASVAQGTSEGISSTSAEVASVADDPDQQRPGTVQTDVPLLLDALSQQELGSETQRSETDDLLDLTTPTSGHSVNLSELSWQTVSGMFIDSERQHSSLISGEVRYGSPKSAAPRPEEKQESTEGRPEIEEVFYRTALPSLVGAVPIPPRDEEEINEKEKGGMLGSAEKKAEQMEEKNDEKKTEQMEEKNDEEKKTEQMEEKNDEEKKVEQMEEKNDEEKKTEQMEEKNDEEKKVEQMEEKNDEEKKAEQVEKENGKEKKGEEVEEDDKREEEKAREESLEGSSNGKSIDSDTPFISVEVKTVIETQVLDDDEEGESRPGLELKIEATVDIKDAEETRREAEGSSGGEEKEMSDGKTVAGLGDARDGPRESSSGESVSTVSSAATEIKRSDSGRRNLGSSSAKSLLTSQSLDMKGRNPLLRTRSLSTFRQGVTDFEVWSAIENELEEAASKIQSKFRSYKTRKKLQRENAVQITTEEFSASTTPAEPDDRQQSTGEFHDSIVLSDHPR